MRKLKLESLTVESFDTTPIAPRVRGTVDGHQVGITTETYDVDRCGQTNVFDCTFGCSNFTGCEGPCGPTQYRCVLLTDVDCA